MPLIDVRKDPETLTLTLTAQFDAPVEQVWQVWKNPRLLERWWGPPTYPATVVAHDLAPGGTVTYFMTGPSGEKHHGWWRVTSVEAPHRLEFEDGFADDSGRPDPGMPTMNVRVDFKAEGGTATVMTVESTFGSVEAMEQLVAMGMVEGMTEAMNQIDRLLDDTAG